MRTLWFSGLLVLLVVFFQNTVFAQNENLEKCVKLMLHEIIVTYPPKEWEFHGKIAPYSTLQSFKDLKEKGLNIVPAIISEYKNPSNDFSSNICVGLALGDIYASVTKTNSAPEVYPWSGEDPAEQWYGGLELAEERCELLYKIYRKTQDTIIKQIILDAYTAMGAFAIPYVIEKINSGDNDAFCSILQNMFSNELKGKKRQEILAWWEINKEKYCIPSVAEPGHVNTPPYKYLISTKAWTIQENVDKIYRDWSNRHYIGDLKGMAKSQQIRMKRSIELAKLIGYENTPQFHFLVDLGAEALPYLFLKLKEEETRFTLPVIEKIMGQKLTEEEIEKQIREAENLLKKPEPLVFREWTSANGKFSIEAKYLSSTKQQVTLEKANGTVITVDLSKLSEADRDYVKKQSVTETQTPKDEKLND
jgi:hypothetical protein